MQMESGLLAALDIYAPKREYSTNLRAMVHGVGMVCPLSLSKLKALVESRSMEPPVSADIIEAGVPHSEQE